MEGTLTRGKKWASGNGVTGTTYTLFSFSGETSNGHRMCYIDIALNFTPSTIIVYSYLTGGEYISIFNNEGVSYSSKNVKVSTYSKNSFTTASHNFIADNKIVLGGNVYRIPVMNSNMQSIWYAYE